MNRTEKKWRQHLEAAEAEGLTLHAYAKKHGLNSSSLYAWAKKLQLPMIDGTRPTEKPVEGTVVLALENLRAHVVIDAETDLELLRRVLEVVA